ncbi:hypothetical protein [Enteractinococcus helveticum]|uniref:hypothetical protein n=1 Tax=Enteractinococcus helveticum TaxID=1837282 RepID=UPI0005BE1158|nr:hypothetical protein [Enteractinococcus helveticum]
MSSTSELKRLMALASIVGMLVLGGCATGESPSPHTSTVAPTERSQVNLLTYTPVEDQGSAEAAFEGRLIGESSDQYLYGEDANGGRVGIVFPEGTTLSLDDEEVILPDGTRIPINTEVSLTGGYSEDPGSTVPERPFEEYFYING